MHGPVSLAGCLQTALQAHLDCKRGMILLSGATLLRPSEERALIQFGLHALQAIPPTAGTVSSAAGTARLQPIRLQPAVVGSLPCFAC